MNDSAAMSLEGLEQQPLHLFMEQAYLNYSMYVIMDRALPHIGDGLKPVQRRIIFAMNELGLSAKSSYKKSARTVGDVLGKYHPHGDSACYEAMVLMAQPFSYRYPLVDGQGNWGAPDDPKSFAAMRYTEAKLSRFAQMLLQDIAPGTVEWSTNFDGSLQEPKVLPARLPHILLNGITGIAVGMATDVPPHNIREVAKACIALLDNPQLSIAELMTYIKGPDYPTAAPIITPPQDILAMYSTGKGSIRQRAAYTVDQHNGDIIITALPFQASGAKIIEQLAELLLAKKMPLLADIRDESDHHYPTRLVLVPKSKKSDPELLMQAAFALTDLEKTYRVNLNILGLDNKPQVKNLQHILTEWLTYRRQTVTRRLQARVAQIEQRLPILEGLLIAHAHLTAIIALIQTEDNPKPLLAERYGLTLPQIEGILELKLRQLAKLEQAGLLTQVDTLQAELTELNHYLQNPLALNQLLKSELQADSKLYGDSRCSPLITATPAKTPPPQAMTLSADPVTLILSQKGWVRHAKGHDIVADTLSYKPEDSLLLSVQGFANQTAVFLSNQGRAYSIGVQQLPSARSQGEAIRALFELAPDEYIQHAVLVIPSEYYLLATTQGYGFVCAGQDLLSKAKSGKALISMDPHDTLMTPCQIIPEGDCFCLSKEGRLLIFPIQELPVLSKGKGNKIMNLAQHNALPDGSQNTLQQLVVLPQRAAIALLGGEPPIVLNPSALAPFRSSRGRKGKRIPQYFSHHNHFIQHQP